MNRTTRGVMALCAMLQATACAQSVHQTERLTRSDFVVDPGYAGNQSYPSGPAPDMALGMGSDMVPAIGGIPSGTVAIRTGLSVMGGTADMVALAGRVSRQVCMGRGLRHRLTRRPNSRKSPKYTSPVQAGSVVRYTSFPQCRSGLLCTGNYSGLFDTFFEAVIPSPARPGLSGVPTPRSHP